MSKVTYRGKTLFYQEMGEGPVVIFLHGSHLLPLGTKSLKEMVQRLYNG